MVKITNIISEYMQSHRRLTVPGLGSFLSRGGDSKIIFSEFAKGDDGVLRSELVKCGVVEVNAAAEIEEFVESVKQQLEMSGGSFEIDGVGLLVMREGIVLDGQCIQQPKQLEQSEESEVVAVEEESEEIEYEYEYEEVDEDDEQSQDSPYKKGGRKIDPLFLFLIVAAFVAVGFFVNGFIIGWRVGSIVLPERMDNVMVKIFGDGFDAVEVVESFPVEDVE